MTLWAVKDKAKGGNMKKSFIVIVLLVVINLVFSLSALNAEENRRDGNWWRTLENKSYRVQYLVGFLDGTILGNYFSYWEFYNNKKDNEFSAKVLKSFSTYYNKYLNDVTTGQLCDGLDEFYKDYKNRKIIIPDAVWLVVNGIAGTPKEELDKRIESFRKNAK